MTRRLFALFLATAIALTFASAQAQPPLGLRLVVGAATGGGVSSGGQFSVAGTTASAGSAQPTGGQFSLVVGVAPVAPPDARLYLPQIAR